MIYIYALACPFSGVVRYIGKCKDIEKRFYRHLAKAKSNKPTHHHSTRWIRLILSQGGEPVIRKLISMPDNADWRHFEKVTISRYRRAGYDLTNLTGGGDGFHDASPEVLKRRGAARSAWLSDPDNKAEHIAAVLRGKKRDGHKQRASDGCRSAWQNPETRENFIAGMRDPAAVERRSQATQRRYQDPIELELQSIRMKKVASAPEWREAQSARSIAFHANPETKAKHSAGLKRAFSDPEVKARLRAAIQKTMSNPDVREKISKATKAHFSDPVNRQKRLEKFRSDDVRAKLSASAKAKWKDPEFLAANKLRMSSPEHRAKMSEAAKRRATPEYRAMMAEKRRQAWQRQKSQQQE